MKFYGVDDVYSESGVDLTLLRENLRRPWEERLRQNQAMLRVVHGLEANWMKPQEQIAAPFDPVPMLTLLVSHQIKFVLIGGLAMTAHGSAYITKDLYVCYQRSAENAAAMAQALAGVHPYMRGAPPGLPFHWDARTILAGLNFSLVTDLGDVGFLGEVGGVGFFDAVFARSEKKKLYNLEIDVLSVDALIASKKAAGRTKDQLHVLELEELKKMKESREKEGTLDKD
jgi:hypothetical protein